MSATAPSNGTADVNGPLWGARAERWGELEEQQLPVYTAVLDRLEVGEGTTLLEVGCGSGVHLRAAVDRGVRVTGLDAAEGMLEVARRRVPEADLRPGDLQFLPFDDDSFDVVAGFNSFFFAADMLSAVREAGRVARPGGAVVIQVWGRPERCELHEGMRLIAPLRPGPHDPPPVLSAPGVLEGIATQAGLTPGEAFGVTCDLTHPDEETMLARMLAPGIIVQAIAHSGEDAVREAMREGMERFRTPDGGYRLSNEWHVLIATAP